MRSSTSETGLSSVQKRKSTEVKDDFSWTYSFPPHTQAGARESSNYTHVTNLKLATISTFVFPLGSQIKQHTSQLTFWKEITRAKNMISKIILLSSCLFLFGMEVESKIVLGKVGYILYIFLYLNFNSNVKFSSAYVVVTPLNVSNLYHYITFPLSYFDRILSSFRKLT